MLCCIMLEHNAKTNCMAYFSTIGHWYLTWRLEELKEELKNLHRFFKSSSGIKLSVLEQPGAEPSGVPSNMLLFQYYKNQ